jgi:hypothetical protein
MSTTTDPIADSMAAALAEGYQPSLRGFQVINVPGHIWPSLWDLSRKAVILSGHVNYQIGGVRLRSVDIKRPEWISGIVRVWHGTVGRVTERDARLIGLDGPQPLVALVDMMRSKGLSAASEITVVEFA